MVSEIGLRLGEAFLHPRDLFLFTVLACTSLAVLGLELRVSASGFAGQLVTLLFIVVSASLVSILELSSRDSWKTLGLAVFSVLLVSLYWGRFLYFGSDSFIELRDVVTTVESGRWITNLQDPYSGVLSLEIGAPMIVLVTGLDPLSVQKFLPALTIFCCSLSIYLICSRLDLRRPYIASLFFLLASGVVSTGIGATRQLNSYLFMLLIIYVILIRLNHAPTPAVAVSLVLSFGLVSSNYSTGYFAMGILVLIWVFMVIAGMKSASRVLAFVSMTCVLMVLYWLLVTGFMEAHILAVAKDITRLLIAGSTSPFLQSLEAPTLLLRFYFTVYTYALVGLGWVIFSYRIIRSRLTSDEKSMQVAKILYLATTVWCCLLSLWILVPRLGVLYYTDRLITLGFLLLLPVFGAECPSVLADLCRKLKTQKVNHLIKFLLISLLLLPVAWGYILYPPQLTTSDSELKFSEIETVAVSYEHNLRTALFVSGYVPEHSTIQGDLRSWFVCYLVGRQIELVVDLPQPYSPVVLMPVLHATVVLRSYEVQTKYRSITRVASFTDVPFNVLYTNGIDFIVQQY